MAASPSTRLSEAENVAFQNQLDVENSATPGRQLTPDSEASLVSRESLWDEDDNLNQDDDGPHTPLTPLSTYEFDLTVEESDEPEPDPRSSDPESDRPLPTIRLPLLEPIAGGPETRAETELDEIIPGWLFGEITQTVDSILDTELDNIIPRWLFGEITQTVDPNSDTSDEARSRITRVPDGTHPAPIYNLRLLQQGVSAVVTSAAVVPNAQDEPVGSGNGSTPPTSSSTGTSQARTLLDISRVPFHSLQTLSKILPMDSKERLRIEPKICVASTKKIGHPRCKKTTATSEILQPTPSRPTGSVMDPITSASLSLIRGLIDSSLCGNCHRRPSRAEFDRICDDLDTMCDADRAIFNKWIRAIIFGSVGENSPTVAPDPPQLIHSTLTITRRPAASVVFSTGHRPVTRSLTYLPAISSSTQHAQRFSLYRPISSTGTSASAAIWSLLMKPLSKQDLLEGQIYMYRTRGNLEYLKIGLTTRDVFQRLSEWVRQCGHETIPVHSWTIPVPHVYRVEKLVHAELKDVRYQEADCVKCGKTHKEWFHETVHHASRVFEKWAMWMASPLYECIEGYWRLNPSIARERIAELCQPLERQL